MRLASARAFSPQSRFAEYELIDDRSAYVETLTADEGLLRVRHTLTLVFDKHQADAWFDRRWLERCADRCAALRREAALKKLPKAQKELLCTAWQAAGRPFAEHGAGSAG